MHTLFLVNLGAKPRHINLKKGIKKILIKNLRVKQDAMRIIIKKEPSPNFLLTQTFPRTLKQQKGTGWLHLQPTNQKIKIKPDGYVFS